MSSDQFADEDSITQPQVYVRTTEHKTAISATHPELLPQSEAPAELRNSLTDSLPWPDPSAFQDFWLVHHYRVNLTVRPHFGHNTSKLDVILATLAYPTRHRRRRSIHKFSYVTSLWKNIRILEPRKFGDMPVLLGVIWLLGRIRTELTAHIQRVRLAVLSYGLSYVDQKFKRKT